MAPRADEGLPAHAGEVERNLRGQVVSPDVLEALDEVEGLHQRLIVRRCAKREHVGQAEQLGPIGAIQAPHQGPIIVVVVGGDLFVAFPEGFRATIVLENIPDSLAQGGVLYGCFDNLFTTVLIGLDVQIGPDDVAIAVQRLFRFDVDGHER